MNYLNCGTPEKYKKEYILLTGGAGYIGSSIAYFLLKSGKNVIIIDNYCNSSQSNTDNLPNQNNLLIFNINCCNQSALEHVFISYKINAIIHLAGYKAVAESIQKPLLYYENNLISTINLLNLVKSYNISKFIFSSSATVYGSTRSPLLETSQTGVGITNPYGQTKYFIERIIIDTANTLPKTQFVMLRYFNPVGTVENGLIVENPKDIPNNIMPVIIRSYKNKTSFQVFGSDYETKDGTPARDYIHIEDLARGHICALDYTSNQTNLEIFNLGTGNPYTVLEFINTFEQVNNVKLNYILGNRRPGDLETVYCDPKKAETMMGWKATKTIRDMCNFRFLTE